MGASQSQEEGYAAGALAPQVVMENRSLKLVPDGICSLVFVVAIAAQLIGGFVMLGSANLKLTADNNGFDFSAPSLLEEFESLNCNNDSRRLQGTFQGTPGIFTIFARAPEIPIVIILLVPIIALIWIMLLTKFARPIVWLTVALNIGVWIGVGVTLQIGIAEADPTVAYIMYGIAGLYIIFAIVTRQKIEDAAANLGMACNILQKIPHVFAVAYIPEVIMIGFLALHWWFMIQSAFIVEIVDCQFAEPGWVRNYTIFMTFVAMWVMAYMNMAKLQITSMAVADWYFTSDDKAQRSGVGWTGLKLAFTKSSGVLSITSILTTIAEFIIHQTSGNWWWLSPMNCILKLFLLCFESLIRAVTRFCVISHSITGLDIEESAKAAYAVLKRNFVGGYVNDRVGAMVVNSGAYAFALALGFSTWAWIDSTTGIATLSEASKESFGFFFAIILLFLYFLRYPVLSIVLIILISSFVTSLFALIGLDGIFLISINTFFASLFVGSIANIILTFQGRVILNAMDTVFFCYAVGKEGNIPIAHADMPTMYVLLDENPQMKPKSGLVVAEPVTAV